MSDKLEACVDSELVGISISCRTFSVGSQAGGINVVFQV